MELILNKPKEIGLKCSIEKYFFGETEMEYLGFWVTRDVVKTVDKNRSNINYDVTDLLKISMSVYRFSEKYRYIW